MTQAAIPALPARAATDPLKAGLRAILNWLERPISDAALDSRIPHLGTAWTMDTLVEAADSLGLEVSHHSV